MEVAERLPTLATAEELVIIRHSLSRMLASSVLLLLVATLLASSASHAFSLGEMKLQSALGQPLRVSIPIVNLRDEEIGSECFRMRPPASSGDGLPAPVTARVSLERTASGDRLLITTRGPVNEPVIQLAVLAQCKLSLQREYTVLLDPPVSAAGGMVLAAIEETATPTLPSRTRAQGKKGTDVAAAGPKSASRDGTTARHDTGAAGNNTTPATAARTSPGSLAAVRDLAPAQPALPGSVVHPIPSAAPASVAAAPSLPITATGATLAAAGRATTEHAAAAASINGSSQAAANKAGAQRSAEVNLASTNAAAGPHILPISTAGASPIAPVRTIAGTPNLTPVRAPEPALWEAAWPAAASFAAGGMVVLGGLALRRRHLARGAPLWSSTAKATMPGAAPATDLDTFAHFAAVTEADFNEKPGSSASFDRHEPSLETASLDTLLGDLNEDAVEERALRDAWAAAQSGLSDDPGSSGAILKAIADAERDLAVSDVSFTLDELEVNLDDHIIPEDDSLVRPLRKIA